MKCIRLAMACVVSVLYSYIPTVAQHKLDLFIGPELLYSDTMYDKVYEVVVNLNPGFKWQMPHYWMLAGQLTIPVYNDYGPYYEKVRPTMFVLSKESCLWHNSYLKCSTGLFNQERYGVHAHWLHHLSQRFSLELQTNLTGFCSFAEDFTHSKLNRLSYVGGLRYYYTPKNIQARLLAGRFIHADYGLRAEIFRHTRYCSIGAFAIKTKQDRTAGFTIIVMLPPYTSSEKHFTIRPASNFRLTNNMDAGSKKASLLFTDPEYNEHEGNFLLTKGGMR